VQHRLRGKHTKELLLFQHTEAYIFFFNFSSIKPDFKNHIAWAVVASRENSSVSNNQEHMIWEATQTCSNSTVYILKQTAFSLGVSISSPVSKINALEKYHSSSLQGV